MASACAYLSHQ